MSSWLLYTAVVTRPPIISGRVIWELTLSVLGLIATITDGATSVGLGQLRNAEKPFSVHPFWRLTVLAMIVPSGSASNPL